MYRENDTIGPYTLLRKLGKGAFGIVWLAEKRTAFGSFEYAIKLAVCDDIDLNAVAEEVATWKDAKGHPNVLPLIDADVYGEEFVIVSEVAPDGSLQGWLNAHGGHAPDAETAVTMTNGILDGLIHLHSKRIIHRDLKPDNILLRGTTPMLADFGLARVLKSSQSSTIAGTPVYMSPEAIRNERAAQVDVWAVGVMLYQMLAGRLPFEGDNIISLINAIAHDAPAPLPASIPAQLREIVACAMQKDLARRYATAQAMRDELRVFTRQQDEARRQAAQQETELDLARRVAEEAERRRAEEERRRQDEAQRRAAAEQKQREAERLRAQAAEREAARQRAVEAKQRRETEERQRQAQQQREAERVRAQETKTRQPQGLAALTAPRRRNGLVAGGAVLALVLSVGVYRFATGDGSTVVPNITQNGGAAIPFDKAIETATLPGNVKMEFVLIPSGNFTMGSLNSEQDRESDEGPQHEVTISRDFYLGRYEVTQAQWQAVMGNNPSYFKNCAGCPVEQVSWDDVQQFIQKLNGQSSGGKYRLPTEAEWEYAARAGTNGPYAGNLDEMAWYDKNSGGKTHPVGEKKANKFGLYDMHGNVYEWCSDWYGPYNGNAVTDPSGPATGSARVIRGGSWNGNPRHVRAAVRDYNSPGYRYDDLGLRLVREQ